MTSQDRTPSPQLLMSLLPRCPNCDCANYLIATAQVGRKTHMTTASCSRCNHDLLAAVREKMGW